MAPQDFIEVWNEAETVHKVCRQFDMTYAAATAKAYRLRKEGFNLKKMHTHEQKVRAGAIGGRAKFPNKGFARDDRNLIQRMLRVPKRAARAGKIGGMISRRTV